MQGHFTFCLDCHSVCDNVYCSLTMFSALAAVCTVDCAIEIVLITLHYITLQSHNNSEEGSKKLAKTEPKQMCFQLLPKGGEG